MEVRFRNKDLIGTKNVAFIIFPKKRINALVLSLLGRLG